MFLQIVNSVGSRLDPEIIGSIITGCLVLLRTGHFALCELFERTNAEKAAKWISEFQRYEATPDSDMWCGAARTFWNHKTPGLMNAYYRGLPFQVFSSLAKNAKIMLCENSTRWMVEDVEHADCVSQQILSTVDRGRDVFAHRLQVFHVLPAVQYLPPANPDTQQELGDKIAVLLRDAQTGVGGYTDSGRDQINQIVPQILTDQLLSSESAWLHLMVSDQLLERIFALGWHDLREKYETGFVLSLQFLVYYRLALKSRARPRSASTQLCRISKHLDSIENDEDPFLADKRHWVRELESQIPGLGKKAYRRLIRQSSAGLIGLSQGAYSLDASRSYRLRQLCLLTSLRAAVASYGLADETERLGRVRSFLTGVGVAKCDAESAIQEFIAPSRKDFTDKAMNFAASLPVHRPAVDLDEYSFPVAQGHTLAALVDNLSELVVKSRKWAKEKKPIGFKDLVNPDYHLEIVGRSIGGIVSMLRRRIRGGKCASHLRKPDVRAIIEKAWQGASAIQTMEAGYTDEINRT